MSFTIHCKNTENTTALYRGQWRFRVTVPSYNEENFETKSRNSDTVEPVHSGSAFAISIDIKLIFHLRPAAINIFTAVWICFQRQHSISIFC